MIINENALNDLVERFTRTTDNKDDAIKEFLSFYNGYLTREEKRYCIEKIINKYSFSVNFGSTLLINEYLRW